MANLAFVLDSFGANLTLYSNCVAFTHQGSTHYFLDSDWHDLYKFIEEYICYCYPFACRAPAQAYTGLAKFTRDQEANSKQVTFFDVASMIVDLIGSKYEGTRTLSMTEFYKMRLQQLASVGITGMACHSEAAARKFDDAGELPYPERAHLQSGVNAASTSTSTIRSKLDSMAVRQDDTLSCLFRPCFLPEVTRDRSKKIRAIHLEGQPGPGDNQYEQEGGISATYDIDSAVEDFNKYWNKGLFAGVDCRLTEKGNASDLAGRNASDDIWTQLPVSAPLVTFICEAARMIKKDDNKSTVYDKDGLFGAVSMILQRQSQLTYQNGHLTKKNDG